MPEGEPVLIAGLSARALAQSARAAGMAPVALDAFGDLDTREAAAWARVPVDRRWRLRLGPLLAAARRLAPAPVPLVWGSGFEAAPGLLAALAEGRPLWGCGPAVVRAVKDPFLFAATAARLGLLHPEVRAEPPASLRGWLCKRAGAAGGGHVGRAAARRPVGRGWYWQRAAPGRPVSALVAGDGARARLLATSRQWAAPGHRRRFRYGGAVVPASLSATAAARLEAAARALTEAFAVQGLASVDALVAGDEVAVLELNPRPGAAFEACELALGVNLFGVHVAACQGELPAAAAVGSAAGCAIVHARRGVTVPAGMAWPAWVGDRSPPGTAIRAGGPVCTVRAIAGDAPTVRALLAERTETVWAAMAGEAGSDG